MTEMCFEIDVSPESLERVCRHEISSQVEEGWYTSDSLQRGSAADDLLTFSRHRPYKGQNLSINFRYSEDPTNYTPGNMIFDVERFLKVIKGAPRLLPSRRPTFVTSAKILQLLMIAPFDKFSWKSPIYAVKLNGIWLLTDSWIDHCHPPNNQLWKYAIRVFKLLHAAGNRFDEWTTRSGCSTHRDWKHVYRIISAHVEDSVLLYSGNVDCRDNNDQLLRLYTREKGVGFFSWLQAWTYGYLMGTKSFFGVVEQKNDAIFLHRCEDYRMYELISDYDKKMCVASLTSILHRLRHSTLEEGIVYELSLDSPSKRIGVRQLN